MRVLFITEHSCLVQWTSRIMEIMDGCTVSTKGERRRITRALYSTSSPHPTFLYSDSRRQILCVSTTSWYPGTSTVDLCMTVNKFSLNMNYLPVLLVVYSEYQTCRHSSTRLSFFIAHIPTALVVDFDKVFSL